MNIEGKLYVRIDRNYVALEQKNIVVLTDSEIEHIKIMCKTSLNSINHFRHPNFPPQVGLDEDQATVESILDKISNR